MPAKRDGDTEEFPSPFAATERERSHPRSAQVALDLGARSHPGKVRPNNEDHFLAARFGRTLVTLATNLPAGQVPDRADEMGYVLMVADGMGGAAAGEVASSLAISATIDLALQNPKWSLVMTPEEVRAGIERWRRRFSQVDAVLDERARSDPALAGMGTTLLVACSLGADLFLFHVGDSRAYLSRGGQLHRLTRDQTMAQGLADAGVIAQEEVATHRWRHVLTQSMGRQDGQVEAEAQHLRLADGDRLLLCTDGLSDMVQDADIATALGRDEPSDGTCQYLVERALEAGGRDNVTVVLARYSFRASPPPTGPDSQ